MKPNVDEMVINGQNGMESKARKLMPQRKAAMSDVEMVLNRNQFYGSKELNMSAYNVHPSVERQN